MPRRFFGTTKNTKDTKENTKIFCVLGDLGVLGGENFFACGASDPKA
jgi:hypothetical protein